MDVGTKELRKHLSDVLDRVARGERILVRRRGRPAAALVPLGERTGRLPSLASFRARIRVRGRPLSAEVVAARKGERS
ncbi:MAG: type II toxin-antitoxin system Phd/YefM family antitoxin [Betaproteobacteria bacterium]